LGKKLETARARPGVVANNDKPKSRSSKKSAEKKKVLPQRGGEQGAWVLK